MKLAAVTAFAFVVGSAVPAALAQDGPMVLTPPGVSTKAPAPKKIVKPKPATNPDAPIDLLPDSGSGSGSVARQAPRIPPLPPRKPTSTETVPADATPPADDLEAPVIADTPPAADEPLPTGNDPLLTAEPEPLPAGEPEPLPLADTGSAVEDELKGPGVKPSSVAKQVEGPILPSATESRSDTPAGDVPADADLAYGAFQRGYYLSAFSLAIPRAEKGDVAAQTLLGFLYEWGWGVPQNPKEAVAWYELAAAGGNREAQFALGSMYLEGRGVTQDRAKAADYFEKSAAAGKTSAMYNLGLLYLEGNARPRDVEKAAELFRSAADSGSSDAQYVLAQLHDEGRGVPLDKAESTRLFGAAAKLGNVAAQVQYAIRLFNGIGTEPDEAASATWFKRAAEVGNPIAQNRLARMLVAGRGVPADAVAAAKWHLLARRAGNNDQFLDDFVDKLTEEQRQVATAAAQRWPLN